MVVPIISQIPSEIRISAVGIVCANVIAVASFVVVLGGELWLLGAGGGRLPSVTTVEVQGVTQRTRPLGLPVV